MKRDLRSILEAYNTSAPCASSRNSMSSQGDISLVNERRRVNPESLALRLGPDLIRELDAIIPKGSTEMPCFALRKDIQERFNLDR